jgi:hypothetical protein
MLIYNYLQKEFRPFPENLLKFTPAVQSEI